MTGGRLSVTACDDAAIAARIHRDTVAVAYAEYFAGRAPPSPAELRATWRRRLADPDTSARVATVGGEPVGIVAVGRDELLGLFVVPGCWDRGVGSALHDAALDALPTGGSPVTGCPRGRESSPVRGRTPSG